MEIARLETAYFNHVDVETMADGETAWELGKWSGAKVDTLVSRHPATDGWEIATYEEVYIESKEDLKNMEDIKGLEDIENEEDEPIVEDAFGSLYVVKITYDPENIELLNEEIEEWEKENGEYVY